MQKFCHLLLLIKPAANPALPALKDASYINQIFNSLKWGKLASIKYLCIKISNQFYRYYLNLFSLLLMVLVVLWLI